MRFLPVLLLAACAPSAVLEIGSTPVDEERPDQAIAPSPSFHGWQDSGDSGDTAEEPFALDDIAPLHGSTLGGTRLLFQGEGLDQVVEVWIGGALAEIVSLEATRLEVLTPPSGAPGQANIRLVGSAHSLQPDSPFTYWEDATGLQTALASWTFIDMARTSHWQDAESGVAARMAWFEPTSRDLPPFWGTSMDACVRDDGWTHEEPWVQMNGQSVGSEVVVSRDGSAEAVSWESRTDHYHSLLGTGAWTAGVEHDLQFSGGATAPPLAIPGAFETPASLAVISPPVYEQAVPRVGVDNFVVRYAASSADYGVIRLLSTQDDTAVRCLVTPDGSFTLPEGLLEDFQGHYVELQVAIHNTHTSAAPHNNGLLLAQGGHMVVGLVYVRQWWERW